MDIPTVFLRHRVLVEPYMGSSGSGPVYDEAVSVAAMVDTTGTLAGDKSETTGSPTTLICRLNQAPVLVPESRVSYQGRVYRVASAARRDDAGFGAWQHLYVQLQ